MLVWISFAAPVNLFIITNLVEFCEKIYQTSNKNHIRIEVLLPAMIKGVLSHGILTWENMIECLDKRVVDIYIAGWHVMSRRPCWLVGTKEYMILHAIVSISQHDRRFNVLWISGDWLQSLFRYTIRLTRKIFTCEVNSF